MSLIKREHALWPAETLWSDDRIDRMFRDMFRDFFTGGAMMDRFFEGRGLTMMRVEEYIEDGICVICAELPGIDPDKDVEITVADGILHLEAHREERSEEQRPHGYRSEFHYGSFARSIRLPEGATEADVKASYKDGILEIRVPIAAMRDKPAMKVPIEHS